MRRLLLLPLAVAPAAVVFNASLHVTRAEPAPSPCGTYDIDAYEIDGGIAFGLAAVTVTGDGGGMPGHEVFAVFTDSDGDQIGEPVLLVTDPSGSASMTAPPAATGVEFLAEVPASGCVGDPEVVSVARAVPATDRSPAADVGAPPASAVSTQAAVVNGQTGIDAADPSPDDAPLPHTGRGIEVASAVALICLVVGWWFRDWSRSGVAGPT